MASVPVSIAGSMGMAEGTDALAIKPRATVRGGRKRKSSLVTTNALESIFPVVHPNQIDASSDRSVSQGMALLNAEQDPEVVCVRFALVVNKTM